ncbi:MAG: RHS repeat-associated core domain-containing protein [Chloroflexota bacterium]|nr:RHS repeat-associated core domain-containing protein [Chloroflexota bacterium]
MTAFGGTGYSYDRNGNLKAFGSNSLNYDASNKWTSGTVNGNSVEFGYNGQGRRSFRTVGTDRIDYWYDVTGLTLQTGANPATYLRDPDGTLLSVDTDQLYNYGRDRLGSVTAMVTTGQSVARSYSYDPWGETIGLTGTAYNPFLFTGVYKDGATGLYSMTQRYYQSATGRFTQLDPLPSQLLTVNRYAYADCNPANFTDPSGLRHCGDSRQGLEMILEFEFNTGLFVATAVVATLPLSGPALATLAFTGGLAVVSASKLGQCLHPAG